MKIIEWLKSIFAKFFSKKEYMLNEKNEELIRYPEEQREKEAFLQELNEEVSSVTKSREEILMSLTDEIIVEDLSETYTYGKFSEEGIRQRYDKYNVLSSNDVTAINCLYGAIKEGNISEPEFARNKIHDFLKEKMDNIVILIDLMIEDAKKLYEEMMNDSIYTVKPDSIKSVIPGSYMDISSIIEEYKMEIEVSASQE